MQNRPMTNNIFQCDFLLMSKKIKNVFFRKKKTVQKIEKLFTVVKLSKQILVQGEKNILYNSVCPILWRVVRFISKVCNISPSMKSPTVVMKISNNLTVSIEGCQQYWSCVFVILCIQIGTYFLEFKNRVRLFRNKQVYLSNFMLMHTQGKLKKKILLLLMPPILISAKNALISHQRFLLEANHSQNHGVSLFSPTDNHP